MFLVHPFCYYSVCFHFHMSFRFQFLSLYNLGYIFSVEVPKCQLYLLFSVSRIARNQENWVSCSSLIYALC
jgi:hypothetical protein